MRFTPYDANPNGYNIQEIGIGKAFCRLGYDYEHICFKRNNQKSWVFYEANGCKAVYTEMPRTRIARMGYNKDLYKDEFLKQYDIIICREYNQIMSYLVSKHSDRACLYSGPYWNMFMLKFTSSIYDFLFGKAINRNMNAKFVKSVLAKDFLEKKGYTNVVNVGVGLDMERFDKEDKIEEDTQRIVDYMQKNPCMLFVGRLNANKNFPLLIETYKKVLDVHPDVKFVMIGLPEQTTLGKILRKSDESYVQGVLKKYPKNVCDGIYRVSKINNPQLKYIYPLAKAFLLPSKKEIFGMVLLEAMYLGAPVITSKNGGSMTLIGDDGPGQMIPEYDADKWAKAVLKYLDHPQFTNLITKEAHQLIVEQYTWDSIAQKMLNNIDRV